MEVSIPFEKYILLLKAEYKLATLGLVLQTLNNPLYKGAYNEMLKEELKQEVRMFAKEQFGDKAEEALLSQHEFIYDWEV